MLVKRSVRRCRGHASGIRRACGSSGGSVDTEMTNDWSHEETDDPLYADRRNF